MVDSERKNSALFLALLDALARRHPTARRIHLVLDYKIQNPQRVARYLREEGRRIVLPFLPPYSPHANRTKCLWREVHANVTRNHRCATMPELWRTLWWYLRCELRMRSRRREPREADPLFEVIAP